ncbi:MAG TPA: regulatory protein RecX, partial [Acidobacteria bacterium]|nr:regulatory protein RecX [Acidobacteriota bacterium]
MTEAFNKAVDLLSRRDHLEAELREKLRRRGISTEDIEAALERCRRLGYLDDAAVARRFVEVRAVAKGWGPARLRAELLRRGAASDVAEEAARLDDDVAAAALRSALKRVERGQPEGWWRLHERRGRVISSLVKRG